MTSTRQDDAGLWQAGADCTLQITPVQTAKYSKPAASVSIVAECRDTHLEQQVQEMEQYPADSDAQHRGDVEFPHQLTGSHLVVRALKFQEGSASGTKASAEHCSRCCVLEAKLQELQAQVGAGLCPKLLLQLGDLRTALLCIASASLDSRMNHAVCQEELGSEPPSLLMQYEVHLERLDADIREDARELRISNQVGLLSAKFAAPFASLFCSTAKIGDHAAKVLGRNNLILRQGVVQETRILLP